MSHAKIDNFGGCKIFGKRSFERCVRAHAGFLFLLSFFFYSKIERQFNDEDSPDQYYIEFEPLAAVLDEPENDQENDSPLANLCENQPDNLDPFLAECHHDREVTPHERILTAGEEGFIEIFKDYRPNSVLQVLDSLEGLQKFSMTETKKRLELLSNLEAKFPQKSWQQIFDGLERRNFSEVDTEQFLKVSVEISVPKIASSTPR